MLQCRVCRHPQRPVIDADLAAGCSLRTVAQRYALGKSTVWRHWTRHSYRPSGPPSPPAAGVLSPGQAAALAQGLEKLQQLCQSMAAALGQGDPGRVTAAAEGQAAAPLVRSRVAPLAHPYVPPWLPLARHREFLQRFHAAMQRAQAARGGRWRGRLDQVLTTRRILGGLATAFKYGRTAGAWGKAFHGRRGQKALQRTLDNAGVPRGDYMRDLGRRGGQATARTRRQQDQPVLDIARLVGDARPPTTAQNAFFS